jgi:uncharacterized protein
MRFIALGGANEVGASSYLYLLEEATLLIDAGLRPGMIGEASIPLLEPLKSFPPDLMLITHAHLDHVGAIPLISSLFPKMPILCTAPTAKLLPQVFADTLKIGQSQGMPIFNIAQMKHALERLEIVDMNALLERVGPESKGSQPFTLQLAPAGHLIGAVSVLIHSPNARGGKIEGEKTREREGEKRIGEGDSPLATLSLTNNEQRITNNEPDNGQRTTDHENGATVLHTGDFSNIAGATTPAVHKPETLFPVDAVITEATYGDTNLPSRKEQIKAFIHALKEVLERGGKVLIPTFALGRSQEIIQILVSHFASGLLPKVPVYLDGMVRSVTESYESLLEWMPDALQNQVKNSRQAPFLRAPIEMVTSDDLRDSILERKTSCIILSSSGMLHAGRSPFYARALLPHPDNALFIVGYQDAESPGRRLLELERGGEVMLPAQSKGKERAEMVSVTVNCQVTRFYLSAHADRNGIISHLGFYPSPKILLTHGEKNARGALREHFQSKVEVVEPRAGEIIDLLDAKPPRAIAHFAMPGQKRLEQLEQAGITGPNGERAGVAGGFEGKVKFARGILEGVYDPEKQTFTLHLDNLKDPSVFVSGIYGLEVRRGNTTAIRLQEKAGHKALETLSVMPKKVREALEGGAVDPKWQVKTHVQTEKKLTLEELAVVHGDRRKAALWAAREIKAGRLKKLETGVYLEV